MNHRLVIEEKAYPEKNGISTLIGVYDTRAESDFIKKLVETKVKFNGTIVEDEVDVVNFPPTSTSVFHYLTRLKEIESNA